MSEDRVPYSAGPDADARRLVPVFQIDREALRRAVRNTLFELHTERQLKEGTGGESERLARIALWEAVLMWVTERDGEVINLVGPPA